MSSVSQNKPLRNRAGFTLLEVLISMAVLVFIVFAVYQATTETFKLRDSLANEGEFYNGIRLATSILQRDISLLYSPVGLANVPKPSPSSDPRNPPPLQPQSLSASGADDLGMSSGFWGQGLDSSGVRPSRFVGSDTKISFVSVSHIRLYHDTPESEFAKISYELRRDSKNNPIEGTSSLVRTENPNAFNMDDSRDPLNRTFEILHGIKSLSFSFYLREGDTWKVMRTWDTEREDTRNIYPDMVEVKIEVVGKKNLNFEGKYRFRPEIPLGGLDARI